MSAFAATPLNAAQQSQPCRRDAMMISSQSDDRSEQRYLIFAPAVIRLHPGDLRTQVGFVRDISEHGIFFYTDTRPEEGSTVGFAFTLSKLAKAPIFVAGRGEVVRVIEPTQGAAIGVAVRVVAPLNIQTTDAAAGSV